jgi:hypothetical protein
MDDKQKVLMVVDAIATNLGDLRTMMEKWFDQGLILKEDSEQIASAKRKLDKYKTQIDSTKNAIQRLRGIERHKRDIQKQAKSAS